MKKYPKMKESGIDWIGEIPEDWNGGRLKFTTSFDLSTIDRHEYDDEIKVAICHYPQVYNNEIISKNTPLPSGTCTQKELKKFRLKKDDILITKDSETPKDIGVPVYIQEDFIDTVCGYHLAQLTTDKNQILGSFLFRFIQSDIANAYFETESHGVTRYGLGKYSIGNLKILLPSISEQKIISKFIDQKNEKINRKISKNKKLIKLLKEKKQSIIDQSVTKGLDLDVPMKDVGIEGIEKIPQSWTKSSMRYVLKFIKSGISRRLTTEDIGYPVLRSTNVIDGKLNLDKIKYWYKEDTKKVNLKNFVLEDKDIILNFINSMAQIGKSCLFVQQARDWIYTTNNFRIKTKIDKLIPEYFIYILNSHYMKELIYSISQHAVNQASFTNDDFKQLSIIYANLNTQGKIIKFLDNQIFKIDSLILKMELHIEKLEEYGQTMTSSLITGKIDVREAIA
jgi:type I restriction enzyme, S subunit